MRSGSMPELRLFRDTNFLGGSVVVNGDTADLKAFGFNDVISSIQVGGGTWTLFQDKDFGGFSVTVSRQGGENKDGMYPSQQWFGNRGDTISSVRFDAE
jgi:Beta/Gamma crystallin